MNFKHIPMVSFVKKLFSDPKFYANLALCVVMVLVIAAAADKTIPQLGKEVWAAAAETITGSGATSALASFTGQHTIGNATVTTFPAAELPSSSVQTSPRSATSNLGVHAACFLTDVQYGGFSVGGVSFGCTITGTSGGSWTLKADKGPVEDYIRCAATCIN